MDTLPRDLTDPEESDNTSNVRHRDRDYGFRVSQAVRSMNRILESDHIYPPLSSLSEARAKILVHRAIQVEKSLAMVRHTLISTHPTLQGELSLWWLSRLCQVSSSRSRFSIPESGWAFGNGREELACCNFSTGTLLPYLTTEHSANKVKATTIELSQQSAQRHGAGPARGATADSIASTPVEATNDLVGTSIATSTTPATTSVKDQTVDNFVPRKYRFFAKLFFLPFYLMLCLVVLEWAWSIVEPSLLNKSTVEDDLSALEVAVAHLQFIYGIVLGLLSIAYAIFW